MFLRTIAKLIVGLSLLLPLVAVGGCAKPEPKAVDLTPRSLPDGAEWRGVYYSQVYGSLHLIEDGGQILGKWRTDAGDAWGELTGKADGDVLTYDWTEHKIGMIGPSANSSGKGFFRYTRPDNGDLDEIAGEWGLGEKMTGNKWVAVLQRNVKPDPDSVMPDEVEGRVTGGADWDEGESYAPPSGEADAEEGSDDEQEEDSGFGDFDGEEEDE